MTGDQLRLTVVLEKRGPAAAIVLTDDQVAALRAPTKTPPVRFTISSQTVQGRIGRMGGENLLGLNKSVRGQLGVDAGDTVDVIIEADLAPREVSLPPELARALDADPSLRALSTTWPRPVVKSMRARWPMPSRRRHANDGSPQLSIR